MDKQVANSSSIMRRDFRGKTGDVTGQSNLLLAPSIETKQKGKTTMTELLLQSKEDDDSASKRLLDTQDWTDDFSITTETKGRKSLAASLLGALYS